MDRVIALVDMDCFYVQVEQRMQPQYKGQPCAVVQYRTYKGGGVIAVGYEARAFGVSRGMMGDDAVEKCPHIHLFRVPELDGKADLASYREASAEVIEVLTQFSKCVERASIDEAYIDLTEEVDKRMASLEARQIDAQMLANTHVIGYEPEEPPDGDDKGSNAGIRRAEGVALWLQNLQEAEEISSQELRLTIGAIIVEEMRAAVYDQTGFRCSAGVSCNKMLAKLVCGINKPNKQTLLPYSGVLDFFETVKITKVRGFGGKFGDLVCQQLEVEKMGELRQYSVKQLQEYFGDKSGMYLYDVCRGVETEEVSDRQLPKSVGCSKNFRGPEMLITKDQVKHWLLRMATEVEERLRKDRSANNRVAKSLHVHMQYVIQKKSTSVSRSCALVKYSAQKMADDAFVLLSKLNKAAPHQPSWSPPITCLGVSATKFTDMSNTSSSSMESFLQGTCKTTPSCSSGNTSISAAPSGTLTQTQSKKDTLEYFMQKSQAAKSPSSQLNVSADVHCVSSSHSSTAAKPKRTSKSFFENYLLRKKQEQLRQQEEETTVHEGNDSGCVSGNTSLCDVPSGSEDHGEGTEEDSGTSDILPGNEDSMESVTSVTNGCPDVAVNENLDMVQCEKCKEKISAWEMPEHLDFHLAMELQRQERVTLSNFSDSSSNHGESSTVKDTPKLPAKRKSETVPTKRRGRPPKVMKSGEGSMKLHQFFSKSS